MYFKLIINYCLVYKFLKENYNDSKCEFFGDVFKFGFSFISCYNKWIIIILGILGNLLVFLVIFFNIWFVILFNLFFGNLVLIDLLSLFVVFFGGIYKYMCRKGFCYVLEMFVVVNCGFL